MELYGVPLETVYLYGLIFSGGLTFLIILFNDVFSGLELPDIFNPTLILSFLTIFFASGFLFESVTDLQGGLIISFSFLLALATVTLLNVFVLVPVSRAESSLTFHDHDLRGRVGMVLTAVPVDGFGEVLIQSNSGSISKTAASFKNEQIASDTKVLIIEVRNGVVYVMPHYN